MKKVIKLLVVCLSFIFIVSCGNTQKALEYNNAMVAIQTSVISKFLSFTNKVQSLDSLSAQEERAKILVYVEKGLVDLKALKFDGDDKGMKINFTNLMQFYKKTINKDYENLIALSFAKVQNEESAKKINDLVEKFTNEEKMLDEKFSQAQQSFAKDNNFKIERNQLQDEIDNR